MHCTATAYIFLFHFCGYNIKFKPYYTPKLFIAATADETKVEN